MNSSVHKSFSLCYLVIFCLATWTACAAGDPELASPLSAKACAETGRGIYLTENKDAADIQRSFIFVDAAAELNPRADYILPLLLRIGSQTAGGFEVPRLISVLRDYVKPNSDLVPARRAIAKAIEQLNSWEQREEFLSRLFTILKQKNTVLASELATELGLMWFEKAQIETAANYFAQAYDLNPYNQTAFNKLDAIYRTGGGGFNRADYALNLRYRLAENRFSLSRALDFATYLEKAEAFRPAVEAYTYSSALFSYLNEDKSLPASIYLPWILAAYRADRPDICTRIAEMVQKDSGFDLITRAIAAKAAVKAGQKKKVSLAELGNKIEEIAASGQEAQADPVAMAWYYSFILPETDKALTWANRALSADPNNNDVKGILAYVIATDDQANPEDMLPTVRELTASLADQNQIALLAAGIAELRAAEQSSELWTAAIEKLKRAVAVDPVSLPAEKAKQTLIASQSEYKVTGAKAMIEALSQRFGDAAVPKFMPVNEMVEIKFQLSNTELGYGSNLDSKIVVTNRSQDDLVISDEGFFTGDIQIDVQVTGDVQVNLDKIIHRHIQPGEPVAPGGYASIPLKLDIGRLRRMLEIYPQADLKMEFTCTLEPRLSQTREMESTLGQTGIATASADRPGVDLTKEYFQQRLRELDRGSAAQRIKTIELLAGLLAEQEAFEAIKPLYKAVKVERSTLVYGLRSGLKDSNWTVNVSTLNAILNAPGVRDFELMAEVSKKINDKHWPVRLYSIYLLHMRDGEGFDRVLKWVASEDSHKLVRKLAKALLSAEDPNEVGDVSFLN